MKNIILPDFVLLLINKLQSFGYEAYAAGGCVRDLIMQKTPSDYDIATSAKPEQVIEALHPLQIIETGIKHGTVTVLINGYSVEVTTFRNEGNYLNNRRPESVSFDAGVFEDTSRRDFTINAMMYTPQKGIIDYHGGIEDINKKLIRCVGNADERFNEDALRILRALRFASCLGFDIEKSTATAALKSCHLLHNISAERITSEFRKLICGVNAKKVISDNFEIIKSFIPALNVKRDYIAAVIDACPKKDYLRLAALFRYSDNTIPNKLKLDNITKSKIQMLLCYFDENIPAEKYVIKTYMRKISPTLLFDLLDLQIAERVVAQSSTSDITHVKELVQQILEQNECYTLSMLAFDGNDLIKNNIAEGKDIGVVLENLLDAVIKESVPNEKQALLQYATTLVKNH